MGAIANRDHIAEVCTTLASPEFGQKIAQALPAGVTLDRFTRVTLTAVQQNPELILAERQSLYNSVVRCAQDGLLPDGREAALVIFTTKGEKRCQYLPMVFGLRKKAAEHGFSIEAHVVYENDTFDWELGFQPTVTHKPPKLSEARGEPIGAYAVGTDKQTGEKYLEVMSLQEIEQVRAVSRAATSPYGPWVNWWGEQARKTVARRLYKQLPLGAVDQTLASVVEAIDAEYDLPPANGPVLTPEQANTAATLKGTPPQPSPLDDEDPEVVHEGEVVPDAEPDTTGEPAAEEPSLFQAPASARGEA